MARGFRHYIEIVWELTKTDLKLRYSGSALGLIWVFIKPFATFVILLFVFSVFFGQHDPSYKLNLLVGLVLYYYFSEGTTQLTDSLLKRSDIIRQLDFPKTAIIFSSLISSFINFAVSLILFFIIMTAFPSSFSLIQPIGLLFFCVGVIGLSLLILGFGFFASVIQVRFRDLSQIWNVLLQLIMYATPIIYPLAILPEKMRNLILINPLTIIFDSMKSRLIGSTSFVEPWRFWWLMALIILFTLVGYTCFKKQSKSVAEYL